jgi:hypothetical protein
LQERDCTIERVYGWHTTTLTLNASVLSILFAPKMRKKRSIFWGAHAAVSLATIVDLIALGDRVGKGNVA